MSARRYVLVCIWWSQSSNMQGSLDGLWQPRYSMRRAFKKKIIINCCEQSVVDKILNRLVDDKHNCLLQPGIKAAFLRLTIYLKNERKESERLDRMRAGEYRFSSPGGTCSVFFILCCSKVPQPEPWHRLSHKPLTEPLRLRKRSTLWSFVELEQYLRAPDKGSKEMASKRIEQWLSARIYHMRIGYFISFNMSTYKKGAFSWVKSFSVFFVL